MRTEKRSTLSNVENKEERCRTRFFCDGLALHLKYGPVHVHSWAVVVAEPLEILLRVCSQDRALQFSVYCGIAEERKMEQIVTIKVPEGTCGCCQFGNRITSVVQILG